MFSSDLPGCRTQRGEQLSQQRIKKQPARDVEEEIGQVKSVGVVVPEEIIGDEGEILHRPIMRRVGIEKEVMTKRFENEKRTFDERIFAG